MFQANTYCNTYLDPPTGSVGNTLIFRFIGKRGQQLLKAHSHIIMFETSVDLKLKQSCIEVPSSFESLPSSLVFNMNMWG